MSIPRLDLAQPAMDEANDPFDTALISRLANDLYSGTDSGTKALAPTVPVSLPTTVAGVPAHLPSVPTSFPNSFDALFPAPPSPKTEHTGLTGGFPSSSASGPPPVHPSVVAAEPAAAASPTETPSGTHERGDEESHEFGEPRYYEKPFNAGASTVSTPDTQWTTLRSPATSSRPEFPGDPGLYFLRDIQGAGAASHFGLPHPAEGPSLSVFDIEGVRRDFPALHQKVNGKPLIWLDNAATTHKPQSVIDATSQFYGRDNSNIHRAAHTLAARSTELFEAGREKVRQFLGAGDAKEIVFVRGTSEAINLVAQSYGKQNIGAGDEIILSTLEHHANIVPWQILAEQVGASIRVIPINDRGELILEEFPKLFNSRTKIVSVTHVSNALGTVNPIEQIIAIAHAHGVPVLVDGAQSTPHIPINVSALDVDFFVFSGHKVFGPTGIGALYGKAHLLESMPPWQGGGHMIKDVTFERTIYNQAPEKFEAGTPDIAGVVGLGAAVDYLFGVGIPALSAYEHSLLEYATDRLGTVRGIRPIGTAAEKASVFGFVIPGVPNQKVAKYLDEQGIAVRGGHHCAMPAIRHFGIEGSIRPSLAFYNTFAEVDALINALHQFQRN